MSPKELSDCKQRLLLLHKEWKTAIAAHENERAESLDTQCRDLRHLIITFKGTAGAAE